MTVDFETKCEQTALDYIKIHLQEGYLVTAYKDVGNHYWESVYKIRASLSTARKTENSSEKPNNCEPKYEMGMGTLKCDNCSEYGSFKCAKCDGEMYFKRLEPKDEPQTERSK